MPIVHTQTGKKILRKAKSLWVLPYRYDSTVGDYVLGQTVYDLSAIIGDSITLEQQDGDTQTKNNEFTNTPLVKNVTSGEWRVTAQCLDLQNKVMKALFAAYTNDNGAAAMRKDYETLYAYIRVRFNDTSVPDVIMPKVLMNSKLLLQQMRSRGSQGNLGGTAMATLCAIILTTASSGNPGTLLPLSDTINGTTIYEVDSPVLFVPQASKTLILNRRDDEQGCRYYDEILTSPSTNQDCCAHNRVVSDDALSQYSV